MYSCEAFRVTRESSSRVRQPKLPQQQAWEVWQPLELLYGGGMGEEQPRPRWRGIGGVTIKSKPPTRPIEPPIDLYTTSSRLHRSAPDLHRIQRVVPGPQLAIERDEYSWRAPALQHRTPPPPPTSSTSKPKRAIRKSVGTPNPANEFLQQSSRAEMKSPARTPMQHWSMSPATPASFPFGARQTSFSQGLSTPMSAATPTLVASSSKMADQEPSSSCTDWTAQCWSADQEPWSKDASTQPSSIGSPLESRQVPPNMPDDAVAAAAAATAKLDALVPEYSNSPRPQLTTSTPDTRMVACI